MVKAMMALVMILLSDGNGMERPVSVHKMIRGDRLKGIDYEDIRFYIESLEQEVKRLEKNFLILSVVTASRSLLK